MEKQEQQEKPARRNVESEGPKEKKFETRLQLKQTGETPRDTRKFIPPDRSKDSDGNPVRMVSERYFKTKEASCNQYHITVPAGTPLEAMLNPRSYAHIAYRLVPNDEITVIPDDSSWYGKFIVLYADRHQAKVHQLEYHQIAALDDEDLGDEAFEIKHIPNRDVRWCVIRKVDGARIKQGFDSREAAHGWIAKNRRVIAA